MPTFTAVALDRLIEPGASKSMALSRDSNNSRLERRHSTPNAVKDKESYSPASQKPDRGVTIPPKPKLARGASVPPNPKNEREVPLRPNRKIDRRKSSPLTETSSVVEKNHRWTQILPALYATPKSTPLPDSPSSFPPSPYIINHKRRGPRLMKSFSEEDVATHEQANDEVKVDGNRNGVEEVVANESKDDSYIPNSSKESSMDDAIKLSSSTGDLKENHLNGVCHDNGSIDLENGGQGKSRVMKQVTLNLPQEGNNDIFVDPQDSMTARSISDSEGISWEERSLKFMTPMAEFYDAWEELSSESGSHLSMRDLETEEREIRLNLLLEIEKRKQVEETLNNMRNHWKKIHEQLSVVGLTLPEDPSNESMEEDLWQQVYLVRFVSNAIGRGAAKAEVEMEMEAQINLKNFEIARLWDRLHYYEAVNQEMSQRNQEVIARRLRQRRKRQKWVWGSIAAAVSVGSAVLAYSYFKASTSQVQEQEHKPN